MATTNNDSNDGGFRRIVFYDPTQPEEPIDNMPVTPEYSEMCISFALVVEVVNRFNSNTQKSENEKYVIMWNSYKNERGEFEKQDNNISFLQGDDVMGTPYLSTFYTDTTYDDMVRDHGRVVEGLGVESVSVAFENYYVPTVNIKFVDQRGSALFGREELHHDNDQITADTVFGCFFTQPYPKFKLQIKGFFGKPVTYQLVCSNFRGNLNPSNGNFEANVSFIGYQYGLLTDVPFNYLVAAPYCDYIGKSYWEQHQNDDAWMFNDGSGKSVIKLYEMFSKIKKALGDEKLVQYLTTDETTEKSNRLNESASDVIRIINSFIATFKAVTGPHGMYISSDPESWQVLVTYPADITNTGVTVETSNDELKTSFKSVKQAIERHNNTFPQNQISEREGTFVTNSEMPESIEPVHFFIKPITDVADNTSVNTAEPSTKWTYVNPNREPHEGLLVGVQVQDAGPKISKGLDKVIYDDIQGANINTEEFAYLFDFGDIIGQVNNLITIAKSTEDKTKRDIEEAFLVVANRELGFIPYIGNVFRILMAHLETFTHMMFHLNDVVVSNRSMRTKAMLGLMGQTDTPEQMSDFVPPWPMIYKKNSGSSRFSTGEDDTDVLGWVGDINHRFEEEKFVRALYAASYKQAQGGFEEAGKPKNLNYLPIMGLDIINGHSPFSTIGDIKPDNISAIGGIIGMRLAQLIGIGDGSADTNLVKSIGKADAYNFYLKIDGRDKLQDICNTLTKDGGEDTIKAIITCSETGDKFAIEMDGSDIKSHVFETAKHTVGSKNRHPIFAESGDGNLYYTHFVGKNGIALVPQSIPNFNNKKTNIYSNYVQTPGTDNFTVKPVGADETFYSSTFNTFQESAVPDGENVGYSMLRFFTDQPTVDGIINRYNELRDKDSGFTIGLETFKEDFDDILKRYWSDNFGTLSDDLIWFKGLNAYFMVSHPYSYYQGIEKFLWKDKNTAPDPIVGEGESTGGNVLNTQVFKDTMWKEKQCVEYANGVYKIDGTECEINSLVFANIPFYLMMEDRNEDYTLFTSIFYASQSDKKAKAYLFLMSLPYGPSKFKYLGGSNNISYISMLPYGVLLRLGAHYWRKNEMSTSGFDPIVTKFSTPLSIKTPDKDHDYIYFNNDKHFSYGCVISRNSDLSYNSVCAEDLKLDPRAEKEFVTLFENFVRGQLWSSILDKTNINKNGEELYKLVNESFVGNNVAQDKSVLKGDVEAYIRDGKWQPLDTDKCNALTEDLKNLVVSKIGNFGTTYKFISAPSRTGDLYGFLTLLSDQKELQSLFRKVFFGKAIMCTAGPYDDSKTGSDELSDTSVSSDRFKAYVNGFLETVKKIAGSSISQNQVTAEEMEEFDENGVQYTRAVLVSMYRYLKNLWDKWLSQENDDAYNVSKFFDENFLFIDSVYRDIKSRFMINCQILIDTYEDVRSTEDVTLFKFIGDVVTRHHCMFLALPDFITLGRDDKAVKKILKETFSPCPYNSIPPEREQNYFVCIYTPGLSSTPSSGEFNGYRDETLNIWSRNGVNPNTPKHFKMSNFLDGGEDGDGSEHNEMDRYGYNVPAFGVAFGQQHNHLFKNVKLSMETPVITSAVINTLSHVAMKGSGNDHAIAFIGQDIYPVFSNYSYTAEVEMMGDAQIQPLMYFQLMNVPMWRGTYMIFNVTHHMTPGQMTTTFKGMKLGNTNVDYSNAWFTKRVNYDKTIDPDADLCEECNKTADSTPALGSECLDEYGVIRKGCIHNEKMQKVFEDVDHFSRNSVQYKLKKLNKAVDGTEVPQERHWCATAVQYWYSRAGVNLYNFWRPYGNNDYMNATWETSRDNLFVPNGFELVLFGTIATAKSWDASKFKIGDISTTYVFLNGAKKVHAAMWVGNHWRSDFVQRSILVYGSGTDRCGDHSICVWRHPGLQDQSSSSTTTQSAQSGRASTETQRNAIKNRNYHDFQDESSTFVATQSVYPGGALTEVQKNANGYTVRVYKQYGPTRGSDDSYILRVLDRNNVKVMDYPICVGEKMGNKTRSGDRKTPEGDFTIVEVQDSSTWKHNFKDGQGDILCYGRWFLRLNGNHGIGIHGVGSNKKANIYNVPNKDGTMGTGRGSDGSIRLLDDDLIDFHDRFAYKGMPVKILPDQPER